MVMALTLTQTADLTKKAFIFGVVSLVLIIFGWVGFTLYKNSQIKPPSILEEKPDTRFNLLPKLKFKKSVAPSSNYTYELITETGKLPENFPKLMKVYFISKLGTTLLAPNRAKELAERFEFRNGPEILSPTLYKFTNDNEGALTIDLDTGNFDYNRKISTESASLDELEQEVIIADKAKMAEEFKSYLSSKELLREELSIGKTDIFYDQSQQQDSQTARITLWQDGISESEKVKYPVITAKFDEGLIDATVTKYTDEINKYLSLKYIFWPIDLENFATYPLKTAEQAFTQLKEGKGNIVIKPKNTLVDVSNIYIAYFLAEEYQTYLQPVFVFEGEGFAALVPAIPEDQFEKETN